MFVAFVLFVKFNLYGAFRFSMQPETVEVRKTIN